MRRAAALLAGLAFGVAANAQADGWTRAGELALGYDDNAGNAGSRDDVRASGFLYAATSATWERRFGNYTALQLRPGVALEQWRELGQLTNARYSVLARVLHKPGRGFHTPVLGALAGAAARRSASDIRSGFDARIGVSAAAPLTTALQARLEGAHAWRGSSGGGAYDVESASYALDLDWRVAARLVAYGGVRVEEGDFTVTTRGFGVIGPKTEHLYLEPRADAIDPDPAFGDDWWAFRVHGRTVIATAGVNVPVSPGLSLDGQVRRGEARMGRFTYERWVGSVGVLFRW